MQYEYDVLETIEPKYLIDKLNAASKDGWRPKGVTSHNRNGINYLVTILERELKKPDAYIQPLLITEDIYD